MIDDFCRALDIALQKTDEKSYWPASGTQICGSFVGIEAEEIIEKISLSRSLGFGEDVVAGAFASPNIIRYILGGNLVPGLKILRLVNKISTKEEAVDTVQYFFRLLRCKLKSGIFCLDGKSLELDSSGVHGILKSGEWVKPDAKLSLLVAKLIAILDAYNWSIYYDFYIDLGLNLHGPYKSVSEGCDLMVRNFFDLRPLAIWPQLKKFKYPQINVFLLTKGENSRLDYFMHKTSVRPLNEALKKFKIEFVYKDKVLNITTAKELEEAINYVTPFIEKQVDKVNSLSISEKIRKGAEINFYQYKGWNKLLNLQSTPSRKVLQQIEKHGLDCWHEFDWKNPQDKPDEERHGWSEACNPRSDFIHKSFLKFAEK